MSTISNDLIKELSVEQPSAVVSVYMPKHHISTPATMKEDSIRLKNLLHEAFTQWQEKEPDLNYSALRADVEKKIDEQEIWDTASSAVALFISPTTCHVVTLPLETSEYVRVDNCFDTGPLMVAASHDQKYNSLTLALHDSKLYRGNNKELTQIEIAFPSSPEDALNIDEMFSGSNTIRGMSTGRGGNETLSTHGQGDSNHAGQEERMKYLRIIDQMILSSDAVDKKLPLVIAATEKEATDFLSVSNYPHLISSFINGNHTSSHPGELLQSAWDVIHDETIHKTASDLIATFNEFKGMQKASSDIDEILEAANSGRVDTLLVGILEKTNDSVEDKNEGQKYLIRINEAYGELHKVMKAVIAQGGKLIGVDNGELATPSHIAALYRY